jgi:hypothetical protein
MIAVGEDIAEASYIVRKLLIIFPEGGAIELIGWAFPLPESLNGVIKCVGHNQIDSQGYEPIGEPFQGI